MEYSLELKMGSKQKEASNAVMEKIQSPRASQDMKFPDQRKVLIKDKRKVENTFGQPFINRNYEFKRGTGDEPMVQPKSCRTKQKHLSRSNTNKGDELVKHMSNLPGYLQQVERGENPQRNALNFGVLDWESLEKWKYGENRLNTKGNMNTSSSISSSSSMPRGGAIVPSTSRSKSLAPQRKQPASNGHRVNTSYDQRSQENLIQLRKFETPQRCTLNEQQNVLNGMSSGRNYCENIKLDKGKRKESYQMTASEKESSLSDWGNPRSPLSLHDRMNSQGGENKKTADEELNLGCEDCSSGHQSIGLCLPNHSPRKSCSSSSQLSESRTSFDSTLTEAHLKNFPDFFSLEFRHSVDLSSEIPHSCPLPVTDNQSDIGLRSDQSLKCQYERPITPSKSKCGEDVAEQLPAKGRFSFSIGRMTRSLSSKEGSVTPRSSSTYSTLKSGTVRFEASAGLDNSNKNKANTSGRAKSSPLRRLLNPLLKSKETSSAETHQPSKGNLNSVSLNPMKKTEGERVQALLQLTMKNGLPLFRLVVDSSSDILAATVKNPPTSVKDNTSLTYVLYSVREIKKKSGGWITQGSKDRISGFGYNVVGEMKVSSSYLSDSIGQNMNGRDVVREFVLYSGDLGQADKENSTPELMPNRELAAIVLKTPSEETDDREDSDKSNRYAQKGFAKSSENENSKRAIVILPDGIHGLPSKGEPSPLITRLRGTCDCEGWDLGCKLQILTNGDRSYKNLKPSMSHSAKDCLDLFVQGKENKPIFSLAPLKDEFYSVEYNASISTLQAFSICIAFMNCWKSHGVFEVNNLSEAKCVPEPMTGKFSLTPPPSPVGRV